jgi:hypothetical protein
MEDGCTVAGDTDDLFLPTHEGGEALVQCGGCQHFSPSLNAPSGRGNCSFYEGSWNTRATQFSGDLHPCPSFVVKSAATKGNGEPLNNLFSGEEFDLYETR